MTTSEINLAPEKDSFNFAHLSIISVCCLFLLGIFVMKNGLPSFSSAAPKVAGIQSPLSKDQIRTHIESEAAKRQVAFTTEELDEISAILDPDSVKGDVEGLMTEVPSFQEVFTPDTMSEIPLNVSSDISEFAIQTYIDEMLKVDVNGNQLGIMSTLGSDDIEQLKQNSSKAHQMVIYLSTMKVPEPFVEYHRLRMIFYNLMRLLSDDAQVEEYSDSFVTNTQLMISLSERMETIISELNKKYNINL